MAHDELGFDQQVTFLPVSDLHASIRFYGEVLGLREVLDQGDCRIYQVNGDAFVGICARPSAGPVESMMFTLVTDRVDDWHDRIAAAGVVCDKAPTRNDKYDLYHAFYRDPDGHVIEVQQFLDPAWPMPRGR